MGYDSRVKENFDNVAHSYDAFSFLQHTVAQLLCDLIPSLNSSNMVLDIGCGTGHIGKILAERSKKIFQVDISNKMCTEAYKNNGGLTVNCSMDHLPFVDTYFDIVVSSMAIHWAENVFDTLKCIKSVMCDGARMYLSVPVVGTLRELSICGDILGVTCSKFYELSDLLDLIHSLDFHVVHFQCRKHVLRYKTLIQFLLEMKMTGVSLSKNTSDSKFNVYDLTRTYTKLFSDGKKVLSSWNIAYLVIKK